jgi:hypothetical protein
MQQTTSTGQVQPGHRISPAIAGLSAAAIACAVTLVMTTSNPAPVAALGQASAAPSTTQCQALTRKLLVSTTSGSSTVRLREGNYLSPPITLTAVPQSVVFPMPRPDSAPVEEVLTIEGNANDVVITSELTNLRKVFDVHGVSAFNVIWKPLKTC